jgi:hypothetical protein
MANAGMRRTAHPNWCRPLPRPLLIPDVMALATLANVRPLIGHLPAERRTRSTWRYIEAQLASAASGKTQPAEAVAALQVVLALEGVPCREK